MVFAEACSQHELSRAKAEHIDKQQELCRALYEKVRIFSSRKHHYILEGTMYKEYRVLLPLTFEGLGK